ncbi:hypothetical protein AB0M43_22170 [Longispora sp. NPDC051575]|uniref:hypothetical protein n=1 Tax=Longispora sp. NPDC051575 TaxID=3154943 RepID=UPI003439BF01
MTHTLVDRIDYTHTCPGDAAPHVVRSEQHIVAVVPGGECESPVTIQVGTVMATVPCTAKAPHRRCRHCTNTTTIRSVTTTHLGYQGPWYLNPYYMITREDGHRWVILAVERDTTADMPVAA